jgi:hypothetical protein
MKEDEKCIWSYSFKIEKKMLIEIYKQRWGDGIKVVFKEVRCEDIEWIGPAEDRVQCQALVNIDVNLWVA